MRILFIAFEVPYPLDRGGRVKTYHFLRALSEHHSVTLVALVRSDQQSLDLAQQFAFCETVIGIPIRMSLERKLWRSALSLLQRKPAIMALYDLPGMHQQIQRLLNDKPFDILYYDHLHMVQYRPEQPGILHVLDEHNVETVLLERVYQNMHWSPKKALAWLEWNKMRHYEVRACRESDYILATTEVDARLLGDWGVPLQHIRVIPIGVDTDHFQPHTNLDENCRTLTIMGTLGWPPNAEGVRWFCRYALPRIVEAVPDVHINIIGDRVPQSIASLARDLHISVLGYVDDIRPYMAQSAALLVPLFTGSGMRVKILEGLAMGIPIVSTPIGYEGIEVIPGRHLLSASQAESFAAAAVSLLQGIALRRQLAASGREFVVERFSWPRIYEAIGDFFGSLPSSRQDTIGV